MSCGSNNTPIGAISVDVSLEKIKSQIADARENSEVVEGSAETGYFIPPTLILNPPPDATILQEETFGPIAPITSFENEAQAWDYINACDLGLSSSVFTKDVDRAWSWAEGLNSGITVVNDWTHFWEHHLPFGGMASNRSGLGRLGGRHTLEFMSDLKIIVFNLGKPTFTRDG